MPECSNILILMTDQQRGDCLSCGGHPCVGTPNMDRLAAEGTRFANAYTSSPVSMPARSTFLSGLFCHNHGQWGNYGFLPTQTDTFARRLSDAGYHTLYVGKSHYYQHQAGEHLDDYKPYMNALGWREVHETTGPFATQRTRSMLSDRLQSLGLLETFRLDYLRRHKAGRAKATWPSPLPPEEHADVFVGRTAVERIEAHDAGKPLLMFVGFGGPHYPWDAPADWAEKYDPAAMDPAQPPTAPPDWATPAAAEHQQKVQSEPAVDPEDVGRCRALYYAKVSHVDWWFGRILDALDRRGMLDNTAVVFWSDHGDMVCDKGRFAKSVFYEPSVHVPFIVRPAGAANGGRTCDALVSTVDALPTILELAGCEAKRGAFGKSLVPLLADAALTNHDAVFSEIGQETMVFDGRFKMVVNGRGEPVMLYDLAQDPQESLNLVGKAGTKETIARLRERTLTWLLATANRQGKTLPDVGSSGGVA